MVANDLDSKTASPLANLASELPDEVLLFLVRNAPPREVWKWLSGDDNAKLRYDVARGFQSAVSSLRQPVVRNRLAQHLRTSPADFDHLLALWAASTPPIVTAVSEMEEESLIAGLPALWVHYGGEALLLALLYGEQERAIEAYATLDPATFEELNAYEESHAPFIEDEDVPLPEADETATEIPSALNEELARTRAETQKWRVQVEQVQNEMASLRLAHQREMQALGLKLKQEDHRRAAAERELQETKKLFDRTSRRQRHTEKEHDELAADSKRLKRQLRQSQQLHEELRKQIASLTARLPQEAPADSLAPAKTKAAEKQPLASPAKTISPFDQQFVWKSDGRQFRVSPREVGRAIDRNDEEFVFALIQAFEALREMNAAGYKLFIERIRALGRYYVRVLTADTTRVLIDASNVARYEKDRWGKGQLKHLIGMRNELRLRDCFPIFMYADASLMYNIDEPAELAAMAKRDELEIVPAGTEADEILAREARRSGAYVVTNDRNFHLKVSPDFEPPRISFRIHDGFLVVDDF